MKHLIPDRPLLPPDGPDGPQRPSSSSSPQRGALSHRQARERLALALDPTTEPELLETLQQHLAGCERCRRELDDLRQAEAWFLTQPVEAPQMAAAQDAVWAAIQTRIAAEGAGSPASNGHLNGHNGHEPVAPASLPAAAEQSTALVPLVPAPLLPHPAGKPIPFTPMKTLIAVLAASFLMSSLVLLAVYVASNGHPPAPNQPTTASASADVLDPGNLTTVIDFDPLSRQVLTLTSDTRYDCPRGWHCPAPLLPCLRMTSLAAESGQATWKLVPTCMSTPESNRTTFTALLDDAALGAAALVDSTGGVTLLDTRSQSAGLSYRLACCQGSLTKAGPTLLDSPDHLLLTATLSERDESPQALTAQDMMTGQTRYQVPIATKSGVLENAVFSAATGWLYLWVACTVTSDATCVEAFEASSGRKVAAWQEPDSSSKPLAADPSQGVLYVSDGGETHILDGHSGATLGSLPLAESMVINQPLHHAYLLGEDGVTVVDTRTRRKLSTLPVLAYDSGYWPTTPAVDERLDRVYLPTMRGKVLMAQDDSSGQLRLHSPVLQATLDAERALTNALATGPFDLNAADLPLGPGSFSFYYELQHTESDGCGWLPVVARTESTARPLSGGGYDVTISLAWTDTAAQQGPLRFDTPPPTQTSYPHQHNWQYRIPASGGAQRTAEQGAVMPQC